MTAAGASPTILPVVHPMFCGTFEPDDVGWSPDGAKLVFSVPDDHGDCGGIFTMNPDGSDQAFLTIVTDPDFNGSRNNSFPAPGRPTARRSRSPLRRCRALQRSGSRIRSATLLRRS